MTDQAITISPDLLDGSWALPRICRRRPPWTKNRISLPLDTFYRFKRTGAGVDLYVIDSGLDTAHSEIAGRATNVYEYYSSGGLGDDHGHGTGVASCAAGETCGPARGAEIFSFKVYNSSGNTDATAVNAAMSQVLSHYTSRAGLGRPAICNISVAFPTDSVSSGVAALIDAGIPVAAAVHNNALQLGSGVNAYPAMNADVLAVGGIGMADTPYYLGNSQDEFGTLQVGTNWGAAIDILAPAQHVRMANAAVLGGGFRTWSGTSFSAPFVAGVLACMLEGGPRLSSRTEVQTLNSLLLANATTGQFQPAEGWGIGSLPDRILYLSPD